MKTDVWLIIIIAMIVILVVICPAWAYKKLMRAYSGAHDYIGAGSRNPIAVLKDLTKFPRSRSEAGVISVLESILHCKCPTVYLPWLKYEGHQLELDGYCEEKKVALEYSGPQHTVWIPSNESYQEYYGRLARDAAKVRLCAENGVTLIVLDYTVPKRHWRDYVLSRLYDVRRDIVSDMPVNYIPEQLAKPFRNELLEKDLGLSPDL